jgi:hypothetical protein
MTLERRNTSPAVNFPLSIQATDALLTLSAHPSPSPTAFAPTSFTFEHSNDSTAATCLNDHELERGPLADSPGVAEDVFAQPFLDLDELFWAFPNEQEQVEETCLNDVDLEDHSADSTERCCASPEPQSECSVEEQGSSVASSSLRSPLKDKQHSTSDHSGEELSCGAAFAEYGDHDSVANTHQSALGGPVTPDRIHHEVSTNDWAPIITDTNDGQPIVIHDTEDESEHVDMTDAQLTCPDSQRRTRSRPLRSQDGMVSWSDVRFEEKNRAKIQRLWLEVQAQWTSMRKLSSLTTSKNIKAFDKKMKKTNNQTQLNNGLTTLKNAQMLSRNFERMIYYLEKRLRGKQSKIIRKVERILNDLHEEAQMTVLIGDHPMGDGDSKDGDYKPQARLPPW